MDEKELREVWRTEFDRVYAVAYMEGFIDGALEGAKQQIAKERKTHEREQEYYGSC